MDNYVVLKALADKRRLKIIELLSSYDLCVGALSRHLGVSESSVSQHLRVLRKAGLVKGEKVGYWTHYRVERDVLVQLSRVLKEIACRPVNSYCIQGGEKCMSKCEHPEELKGRKPGQCSPEQIEKCHGDSKNHPCTTKDEK